MLMVAPWSCGVDRSAAGPVPPHQVDWLNEMQLITAKPAAYLCNMSMKDFLKKKNKWLPKVKEWIDAHGGEPMIPYSGERDQGCPGVGASGLAGLRGPLFCSSLFSALPDPEAGPNLLRSPPFP